MKRLFNQFMKRPDIRIKVYGMASYRRPAEVSTMFNAWMVDTMNHPTEFANKFMVRKWTQDIA
jgi:hypothetical protein